MLNRITQIITRITTVNTCYHNTYSVRLKTPTWNFTIPYFWEIFRACPYASLSPHTSNNLKWLWNVSLEILKLLKLAAVSLMLNFIFAEASLYVCYFGTKHCWPWVNVFGALCTIISNNAKNCCNVCKHSKETAYGGCL